MSYTSLKFSGLDTSVSSISVANNGLLAFGTGDFTIEMYVYRKTTVDTAGNGDIRLFQMGNYPSGKLGLIWGSYPKSSTTPINFSYADAAANITSIVDLSGISETTGVTNNWKHIALCRASGITRFFLHGIQKGSNITDTTNYTDTTTPLIFGAQANGLLNTLFEGYMTGIRISNNARYTGGFFIAPEGYQADDNTLLLLNGSDSNTYGSLSSGVTKNNITNYSSIPNLWKERLTGFLFPANLNPPYQTATATTYVEVTDCSGIRLGTGSFLIEWKQYQYWYDKPTNMRVFSINSWPHAALSVSIENINGTPKFYYWTQGNMYYIADISANNLINQWNTFRITREANGNTKFYRNNVQFGSTLVNLTNVTDSSASSLIIGADGNLETPFTGWFSSFSMNNAYGGAPTSSFRLDTNSLLGNMSSNIYYKVPGSSRTQTYIPFTIENPYPSCFNEGTMILCEVDGEEKYMPIEKLTRGDKVVSYLHGARSILAIGKGSMVNDPSEPKRCMYKLPKTGNMTDDLMITGGHALLVDQQPKGLCFKIDDKFLSFAENDKRCVKMENAETYTYYNLCLENNGNKDQRYGVYANGILCETPSEKQFNDHQYTELL